MNKPMSSVSGAHLRTYKTIFQHPVSHNLEWRAVRGLLGEIGEVATEPNGNLKVTRNGQSLVLRPSLTKDVAETEELMALRHFLERSEHPESTAPAPATHWLVVIDHREARIYRSIEPGSLPQQIRPHVPDEFFRHAQNSKGFTRGQEKPDPNSFFDPVAAMLNGAGQILVVGPGTGMSSEMTQFVDWLKIKHPAVGARIVGTLVVDEHHRTDDQLLATAREFFAARTAA
jgi:hypothetical protein